jgi:type II secretory pathway pseudopilin PulG
MVGGPARRARGRALPARLTPSGRSRRADGRDEAGFSLLELVVAMGVLATIIVGFAASVSLGFRTIALARQRQTATELASARLEHLRSVPYENVALSSQPAHSSDPDNPDFFLSTDATLYDITGDGDEETLIVDDDGTDGALGGVLHLEDPVQVGATVMEIYQYVTWVDDPGVSGTEDYKRVTVVVKYKAPSVNGVNRFVRMSGLFTIGTVTIEPASTTTTTGVATTTAAPTTTTTAAPVSCPADVDAPTGGFVITATSGAEPGFTAGTNVALTLNFTDTCTPITVQFSNDGGTTYSGPVTYAAANQQVSWALSTGDGTKTVDGSVADGAGNSATLTPQSVILDTTLPTSPGTLSRAVSCAGTDRTVSLSWGVSTDTNFRGYRVYRSTDGVTWSALGTTSTTSYSDTHKKSLDSVRYYVVGYDKAGNESDATNLVTLSKNQCS